MLGSTACELGEFVFRFIIAKYRSCLVIVEVQSLCSAVMCVEHAYVITDPFVSEVRAVEYDPASRVRRPLRYDLDTVVIGME